MKYVFSNALNSGLKLVAQLEGDQKVFEVLCVYFVV